MLTSILMVKTISSIGKGFTKNDRIARVKKGSYLHLKLSGTINDHNEFTENIFGENTISTHSIVEKINHATLDENIVGIILEPKYIQCGLANINEISVAIRNFQESDKKVIAYFDIALQKDYLLASVADEIYLNPSASAGIYLTGIGGSSLFYKDMLDKIGVNIEVIHAGKYKGAGESFSRNSYSQSVKKNLNILFTDIYDKILTTISKNRNITFEEIKKIYEERNEISIDKETAVEYGLVDELIFRDELFEKLEISDNKVVNLQKYNILKRKRKDDNIAVIYANGPIVSANSIYGMQNISASRMDKIFDKVQKNNSIKAVVIRVNSPGGSALESEIILNRIKQLRKIKPVVISMGNVAASGGYYISAESDFIFADPFTITGSIGVVAMIPNVYDFTQKIDLNSDKISCGKFADLLNIYTKPNQEEYEALQNDIKDTYFEFKTRVATGRDIPFNDVETIAQGQVWSSDKAKENHLVDEIGILNDAIIKAVQFAEITDYSIKYYPKKKSIFEELLKEKFNLEIASKTLQKDILKELKLDKTIQILRNIKNNPIQAIMLFEVY